ncbi:MAG: serine hydrolase [Planctomycetota bacterium]|jgi:CubicO group peptidase (beta-lactamase class C family)|nr:serine hydrolase [Planctomycetota bacterium]
MTRRRRFVIIAAVAVAVLAVAIATQAPKVPIASGYVAKRLAAGHFVTGADIRTDVLGDDVLLGLLTITVDAAGGSVGADWWGHEPRLARYRPGLGTVLVVDPNRPIAAAAGMVLPPIADDGWLGAVLIDDPRSQALDAVLDVAFAQDGEPEDAIDTRAILVWQDGALVAERYAAGKSPQRRFLGWSMAKAVSTALAGRLVHEGRWRLDEATGLWPPEDPRAGITLEHLLRMTSGLDFIERAAVSDVTRMLYASVDAAAYAAARPGVAAPGARYNYSTGDTVLLCAAMRRRFELDTAYHRYPHDALFAPLGMSSAVLETDQAGNFLGGSMLYATARDWLRFGCFLMQDGVWRGERLLPEGFVAACREPAPHQDRLDLDWRFGRGMWIDHERRWLPDAPQDCFVIWGHHQQVLTIVPSRKAVLLRLGLTRQPEDWDHNAFVRDVLAALDLSDG